MNKEGSKYKKDRLRGDSLNKKERVNDRKKFKKKRRKRRWVDKT